MGMALTTVAELRSTLGVGTLYSDAILQEVCDASDAVLLPMLWADVNFYLLEHVCGLKYKLIGQENIPDERCVLFVKHSSVMEVFIGLRYFSPSSWVGNTP